MDVEVKFIEGDEVKIDDGGVIKNAKVLHSCNAGTVFAIGPTNRPTDTETVFTPSYNVVDIIIELDQL